VRQLAAKWLKVRLDARVLNKIDPGPFYSFIRHQDIGVELAFGFAERFT
jgi:hypothetical protein